jgi:hypothetical protein
MSPTLSSHFRITWPKSDTARTRSRCGPKWKIGTKLLSGKPEWKRPVWSSVRNCEGTSHRDSQTVLTCVHPNMFQGDRCYSDYFFCNRENCRIGKPTDLYWEGGRGNTRFASRPAIRSSWLRFLRVFLTVPSGKYCIITYLRNNPFLSFVFSSSSSSSNHICL